MRRALLLFLLLGLSACSNSQSPDASQFVGSDMTDVTLSSDFVLPDHNGTPRKLADFHGKVVALFFGYTHCPDVCPTTMTDLAGALKLMGEKANDVQVLFISLDPERDSAEVLKKFVPSFNPTFLGLSGDSAQTIKVTQDFKVYFAKQESNSKAGYTIDHSSGVYVFDKKGVLRVIMKSGQSQKEIAHDLSLLL
ncbi:MAG: SCO family protein [Methylophilales bacterium]|nr:SCO family protein [Methylophilales bacterium]